MASPQEMKCSNVAMLAWVLFWGGVALAHISLSPYAADDSYIHFRIARNLVINGEPYFNIHEPVLATSSPLWTLLLSFLFRLGVPLPQIVAVWNAVAVATLSLLAASFLKRYLGSAHRGLLWGSLITCCAVFQPSAELMETPTALAMATLGLVLLSRFPLRGLFVLGLSVFFRFEFSVLALPALGTVMVGKRASIRSSIVALGLGLLIPALLLLGSFQSFIPETIHAKQLLYSVSIGQWAVILLSHYFGTVIFYQLPLLVLCWGLAVILAIFLAVRRVPLRVSEVLVDRNIPLLSGLGVVAAYALKGVLLCEWYLPLFLFPILLGLVAIFRLSTFKERFLVVVLLLPLLLKTTLDLTAAAGRFQLFSGFEYGARARRYLEVGATLAQEQPRAEVLSSEIGALGYAFPGKILDAAGLASPQARAFHPMKIPKDRKSGTIGAIPPQFVAQTAPAIIVTFDIFSEALRRSSVLNDYEDQSLPPFTAEDLVLNSGAELWDHSMLHIYRRKAITLTGNP